MSSCQQDTTTSFISVSGLAVTKNKKVLYVSDTDRQSDLVYYCRLNIDGFVASCNIGLGSNQSGPILENVQIVANLIPFGLAINPAGTFLYVMNVTNILYCPLNSDGSLGTCQVTGQTSSPSFHEIVNIAFNPAGNRVYITDVALPGIYSCSVNTDATLGDCTQTAVNTNFYAPVGITIDAQGDTVYISDDHVSANSSQLYSCPVQYDGSLGTCISTATNTTPAFNELSGISLNPSNNELYVVDANNDLLYYCPNSPTHLFSSCLNSANISGPIAITVG